METMNTRREPERQEFYQSINEKGIECINEFDEISTRAKEYQEKLLLGLIKDNKNTEFGKLHRFDEIQTIEEYQNNVPYTTYKDYEEYIQRMLENQETDLITVYPTRTFLKTSGTQGDAKYMPFSERSKQSTLEIIQHVITRTINEIGNEWTKRKAILPLAPTKEQYSDTIDINSLSTYMLMDILFTDTNLTVTSPSICYTNPSDVDISYLNARFALENQEIGAISSSFMSFILEMHLYIQKNAKMLIEDIEQGTIHSTIKIPDKVRKELEQKLKPNKERADYLRKVFDGEIKGIAKRIWPHLQIVICIGGGAFIPYTKRIYELIGDDVKIMILGYYASECVFSVPMKADDYSSALVAKNGFFEFLSVEEPENQKPKLISELEIGKEYEVVVTNLSGLYRYRMGDVITVRGYYNETPMIEFTRRLKQNINMYGEKTSETTLEIALSEAVKKTKHQIYKYCVCAQPEKMCYTYFVEMDNTLSDISLGDEKVKNDELYILMNALQRELIARNPFYKVLTEAGKLIPVQVYILENGTFEKYNQMLLKMGVNVTQTKPVKIIMKQSQKDFFYAHSIAWTQSMELAKQCLDEISIF